MQHTRSPNEESGICRTTCRPGRSWPATARAQPRSKPAWLAVLAALLLGPGLAPAAVWTSTDWPEYRQYVDSLKALPDDRLAEVTGSPAVVYGFLLAAGEVLDALALADDYRGYPVPVRRHAHRCAYRYLSDRLTWQYAPGHSGSDWPYGGVVVVAQVAFDQCLVINIESEASDDAARTRYLPYEPPAKEESPP